MNKDLEQLIGMHNSDKEFLNNFKSKVKFQTNNTQRITKLDITSKRRESLILKNASILKVEENSSK